MSKPVISVENLSKNYQLGVIGTGTFYGDAKRWWAQVRGQPDPYAKIGEADHGNRAGKNLWALNDVSFQVEHGEALGIIGRNGAGKSTLLKILSRVTAPTSGVVKIKGRIASLLEVGTGFHPELTGRENIYLNGAILGMKKAEIDRKLDEIVDFSGVEQFIDTPVKRYSSGMYVRLAFAVAAHLEPEILVVDEVLAVGDAEFQKKCLGKMSDVTHEGRTVLFVSHNLSAVRDLCQRAILLNHGEISEVGESKNVIANYLNIHYKSLLERRWDNPNEAPGNQFVRLLYAGVENLSDGTQFSLRVDTPLLLRFKIFNLAESRLMHFNYQLYTADNVCVFNTASIPQVFPNGIVEATCEIPANLLNDNTYSVSLMVHIRGADGLHVPDALVFEIEDVGRNAWGWYGEWSGAIRPDLKWNVRSIEE
jgi:lipopolysaccharide transport system ATP-binding protein